MKRMMINTGLFVVYLVLLMFCGAMEFMLFQLFWPSVYGPHGQFAGFLIIVTGALLLIPFRGLWRKREDSAVAEPSGLNAEGPR